MLSSILGPLLAASLLLVDQAQAAGPIAQVVDANNFCTFLPPSDSADRVISDTEWNAQVFCMGNTPAAVGAGKIPDGLIQSAHFVATDDYVQVTGQMDATKGNLLLTDWGGQYDIKAPNPSECAGYKYYVNLVEPASYTYCIRCCNNEANCNRGISEKGCDHIIPGDYSGPVGQDKIAAAQAAADAAVSNGGGPTAPVAASPSANPSPAVSATPSAPSAPSSSSAAAAAASSSSSSAIASQSSAVASASSSSSGSQSHSSADSKPSDDSVTAQSVDGESAATTIHPGTIFLSTLAVAVIGGLSL